MTKTQFLLMAAQRGLYAANLAAQACKVCLAQRQLWANAVRRIARSNEFHRQMREYADPAASSAYAVIYGTDDNASACLY